MNDKSQEIPFTALTGRSFKDYCELFGYDSKGGKDITGKRILDVGPGYSDFVSFVNQNFNNTRAIGVDLSEFSEIKTAALTSNQEMSALPQASAFIRGVAQRLPFKDNSFDDVVSAYLVGWFLKKGSVLEIASEMVRVCKKGGRVMITPSLLDPLNRIHFTREELFKGIQHSKFKVQELRIPRIKEKTTILKKT